MQSWAEGTLSSIYEYEYDDKYEYGDYDYDYDDYGKLSANPFSMQHLVAPNSIFGYDSSF